MRLVNALIPAQNMIFETTLETSGEVGKTILETSGEVGRTTLETSGEDVYYYSLQFHFFRCLMT
jgi:hypothetical protein